MLVNEQNTQGRPIAQSCKERESNTSMHRNPTGVSAKLGVVVGARKLLIYQNDYARLISLYRVNGVECVVREWNGIL